MSSSFNLTPSQRRFWEQENHNAGKPSLALIYPDGEVVMDYPREVINRFKREEKEVIV